MRKRLRLRLGAVGLSTTAAIVAALVIVPLALAGAVSTTDDAGFVYDGTNASGACVHGSSNNCNAYLAKTDVYLSGLPASSSPDAGTYFFAVLDPGQQRDPNDGTTGNLSSPHDAYTARTFSIDASGTITYTGPHAFDQANNSIQAAPFDNTGNNGGVYIMAVCRIDQLSSFNPATNTYDALTTPVGPKDCKYDAFKVDESVNCPPDNPNCAPPPADDLVVMKTATASWVHDYDWSVQKSTTKSEIDTSASSTDVNYTVTATWNDNGDVYSVAGNIDVNNPNSFDITGVVVSDDILNDSNDTCTVHTGSDGTNSYDPAADTIPAGTDVIYPYSCSYSGTPTSGSKETNEATATWDASNGLPDTSKTGDADVNWPSTPTSTTHDTTTVTDTFNGGPTTDTLGVANVDGTFAKDAGNTLWPNSQNATDPTYNSGTQTFTFTYTRSVAVTAGTCTEYDNTAAISDDATSADNTSDASVKVCGGADLTVTKTATPSFKRTYTWSIAKSVDKTYVEQIGGNVTFNYTVKVTQTGVSNGSYTVAGTITVSNPNDWESVTLTGVTDSIDHNGTCSITSGNATATLAPKGDPSGNDSIQLGYSCSFTSNPGSGTNTATATWDKAAAATPDGSKQGTHAYDFTGVSPTLVNKTVTVTDCFSLVPTSCTANTLGTVTANETAPFASRTFTYPRTISGPSYGVCSVYDNTATITETGQYASKEVRVCGFNAALTPGYWKNHAANSKKGGAFYSTSCSSLKSSSCSTLGVWAIQYLPKSLGNFPVNTIVDADGVWGLMNCSSSTDQGAVGCLAGHLLAAKLNVANQSNTCINTAIATADAFLVGIGYTGPAWKGTLTAAQRTTAINLKNTFDKYNNGGGC